MNRAFLNQRRTVYAFDAQKSEANQNKNTKNWHCQFASEQNTIKI